jgi:hypothetical protein
VVDEGGEIVMVLDTPEVAGTDKVEATYDGEGNEISPEVPAIEGKTATYKPLTHQVPRMVTKTRDKFRQEVIEDCLDLNNGQLYAAMYGCIQALQQKVELLEAKS